MRKSKTIISAFLILSFITVCLPGISIYAGVEPGKQETKQQNNPYADAQISIKIIQSINKTFGYDILVDGRRLVHQPNIPALPGNKGFTTREKARKVAEFVVKKIRKNEMPPTVVIDDLNKMNVLK